MKMLRLPTVPDSAVVVFDVETNGLDWKRNKTVGFVIGIDGWTEYLPIRHEGGGNYDEAQVIRWIQSWAKNPNVRVVGHNLKFDLHFAQNDRIEFKGPIECTMVNAALIDENLGGYSLDAIAEHYNLAHKKDEDGLYRHLAELFGGEATRKVQMSRFHRLSGNDAKARAYAIADVRATFALWESQQPILDSENLRLVHGVECRVLRTLQRMERFGVKIDEEKAHEIRNKLQRKLDDARKKIPKDLNVRSPRQLQEWFKQKNISGWPQTEKGNASFPETWLISHEPGRLVVRVRKISNILNSFFDPLLERHIYDGRVHTNFNQLRQDEYGTVTGRLSSSDPNNQQVPKRDRELAPMFRSIYVADRDHIWSANDYSQQEFRVFAEYSGSAMLLEGYRKHPADDIHTVVANLLGVERDPTAKRMNLGMLYGMGKQKLADSLGISIQEAQAYRDQYDKFLPEARRFLKQAEHAARTRGWVRTKLHRRRRFPNRDYAHKAGNAIIQGTSADITKLKMVEIDEFFQRQGAGHLLLQVHDELDWQFPDDDAGMLLDQRARSKMEKFDREDLITLTVRMAVDCKHGPNWGEATFGDAQATDTEKQAKQDRRREEVCGSSKSAKSAGRVVKGSSDSSNQKSKPASSKNRIR